MVTSFEKIGQTCRKERLHWLWKWEYDMVTKVRSYSKGPCNLCQKLWTHGSAVYKGCTFQSGISTRMFILLKNSIISKTHWRVMYPRLIHSFLWLTYYTKMNVKVRKDLRTFESMKVRMRVGMDMSNSSGGGSWGPRWNVFSPTGWLR